jgi:hypothetical protein
MARQAELAYGRVANTDEMALRILEAATSSMALVILRVLTMDFMRRRMSRVDMAIVLIRLRPTS